MFVDSAHHASSACYAVKVTYTNKQPPILTIQDAIDKKSFFPKPANDIVAGDADGTILISVLHNNTTHQIGRITIMFWA